MSAELLLAVSADLDAIRASIDHPIDWLEVGYLKKQLSQSLEALKRSDLEARACEVPV